MLGNGLKVVVSLVVLSSLFLMGQYFNTVNPRVTHIVSKIWFNFEGDAEEGNFDIKYSKFGVTNEKKILKEGIYFEETPHGLGYSGGDSKKSMLIKGAFTRKGYNYIDVIPQKPQAPFPGSMRSFDMWVWGGNFNYILEAHLESYRGFLYRLPMGNLRYYGWRNLTLRIPNTIRRDEQYAPRKKALTFRKFRLYASPQERTDRFHTFFDYAKIVTDMYQEQYDGWELEKLIAEDIDNQQPASAGQPAQ